MNEDRNAGQTQQVPIAWEALEDAFENNAPEVHSYLHCANGEVIRIVDGVADPAMHNRIMNDRSYLRVDPVSSREQYRWMERFIVTVEEPDLRRRLTSAIDGKGAFRRFKDALMNYPLDRERWFAFRSARLRASMEAWLAAHGIEPVERPQWHVPTADEVRVTVDEQVQAPQQVEREAKASAADLQRARLHELADQLPARELEKAKDFLEFLLDRKPLPRSGAKTPSSAPPRRGPDREN